ncbi:VWA domain-containing protein [Luteolibacter sp. GHJ8]|uniref:VWA domain-containing protein n=1 Tax=Luteolibacter rhizosphaerae TaxID=2989719 RepID=A0ABT3G8B8_9BACT|nr:VWA domain-containing protein [Luteolibacter rhizosphaerae]MCW1916050.1 VWA domain-containing protein [Luteolibacter rhizosphaerae]
MRDFLEHFKFAQPQWLLLLIPCVLLFVLRRGRGAEAAMTFSTLSVLVSLGSKVRRSAFSFGMPLAILALVPAILAMARPVWRNEYHSKTASGIDIAIAFDVSLSMSIDDFHTPEGRALKRIDAAKEVVHNFIESRPDDRIGMVIYSGRPYSVSPITLDHDWLLSSFKQVNLNILKEMGTAIGSAIAAASSRLDSRDAKSKIIILCTDGASNSGKISPIEAAENAKTLGIKIYTIAIGTEEGRVSSDIQRFARQEFDLPTLRKIAAITGGQHYHAKSAEELAKYFDTIDQLEKSETISRTVIEDVELFPWFLGTAVVASLVAAFLLALNPPPSP